MSAKAELPRLPCAERAEWEGWLARHHESSPGVWLQLAKAGSAIPSVTYAEAVEAALCYGWIDGQKAKLDERYWLQKFTPRGPRSVWSRINRDKAVELIERGLMQPAGMQEVERAKADGRWDAAYEPQRTAAVPDDLAAALAESPKAKAFFETLNSANRYAILYRVQDAKRPETRARRIEKFVAMLEAGETLH